MIKGYLFVVKLYMKDGRQTCNFCTDLYYLASYPQSRKCKMFNDANVSLVLQTHFLDYKNKQSKNFGPYIQLKQIG